MIVSFDRAPEAARLLSEAPRSAGKKVVFTNGCYDILHVGHLGLFEKARAAGDILIVGVNTDSSVRLNKGADRPFVPEDERARLVHALRPVDHVVLFSDPTPDALIRTLRPDVLVKGAEYGAGEIVGESFLESYGGVTIRYPMLQGHSTTGLVERIQGEAGA